MCGRQCRARVCHPSAGLDTRECLGGQAKGQRPERRQRKLFLAGRGVDLPPAPAPVVSIREAAREILMIRLDWPFSACATQWARAGLLKFPIGISSLLSSFFFFPPLPVTLESIFGASIEFEYAAVHPARSSPPRRRPITLIFLSGHVQLSTASNKLGQQQICVRGMLQ